MATTAPPPASRPGPVLFRRRAAVSVEESGGVAVQVRDLQIRFKITKSLRQEPNTADVQITNLAATTRAKIRQKHALVTVTAGYVGLDGRGTTELLFVGNARTIAHTRDGAEWTTRLQCGDGERAYSEAQIAESLGPGATLQQAITTAVKSFFPLGVDAGNSAGAAAQGTGLVGWAHGLQMQGSAADALTRVTRAANLDWSIQNGKIQILRPGKASALDAIELSAACGLIGSPAFAERDEKDPTKPTVLKAKSLLQPGLVPGRRVYFRRDSSRGANGYYVVQKVEHTGDTWGLDWYSECELIPLAA